ncbi:unnamed protein product [Didymodactylos carnosus]|uniref:RING-type domain-containing protein n=1 Tax=Didymodactylos carnosus TaxID=1234261 RepID=A0A813URU4_9BILA|nr:unnamed protein product [Didymodactylos carnosus]CAF0832970.1 unnamed protein product [Didymodactylos carnosus]CAF3593458.1 unnamed protein product [Didymodactylos carnosus]CAF3620046.1 unnamed protein product [Didymodactylos carnosus]
MAPNKFETTAILTSRVNDGILLHDVYLCPICQNILWKPVACKTCENSFCSKCITSWLSKGRGLCPFKCTYRERKCPSILLSLLSKLEVDCRYKSNGCSKIMYYELLEEHEDECQYQMKQCKGCEQSILLKDLVNHEDECGMVDVICYKCQTIYKQKEMKYHDQIKCLENAMERKMSDALKQQQKMFDERLRLLEENYKKKSQYERIESNYSNKNNNNSSIHSLEQNSTIQAKYATIRGSKRRNTVFNPNIFYN